MSENLIAILKTALGIGFLIFIHELGHFLAARLAGVRVEVFSLGFGPRLFGWRRRATDYRLSLVPLGGYVRVAGEDPTQRRHLNPDDLYSKGFLARALFFSGGVAMNLLFAFVAFPLLFAHGVDFTAPVIGQVARGGPAWEAGLREGDQVKKLDGKPMYSWENLSVEVALAGGDEIQLEIARGDEVVRLPVRPRWSAADGVRQIEAGPIADPRRPRILVDPGSPAARAGLRDGDLLVGVQDQDVDGRTFGAAVARALRGDQPVRLTVLRDGARQVVEFVPERRSSSERRIGVLRAARRVHGLRPGSALVERLGLFRDDHILAVDGRPFAGSDLSPLRKGGPELSLEVRRAGETAPRVLTATIAGGPGAVAAERAALADAIGLGVDTIGAVVDPNPGTAAARAGLEAGDEILAVDGKPITAWTDLTDAVRAAGEAEITLAVQRGTALLEKKLHAEPVQFTDPGFDAHGRILRQEYRVAGFYPSLQAGLVCSVDLIKQLYVTLKRIATGEVAASNLGGIITISRVSYDQAQSGWARFLYFLALLSINLAFINLLPIPVLDGGHLLFLLIERIKGSPVSARVLTYSQILGLVFVLALMVFVTFHDIRRLL
jgi:regulator of sigma E protease